MSDFFTVHSLIAFVLGVLLAGMVRQLFTQVKGKVSGA